MKKRIPLIYIHHLFSAAALLVLCGFLGFLAYLYVAFNAPLIGDIEIDISPDLLAHLDGGRIQTALASLRTRENLPDIPADLPDPYRPPTAP